jgi:hypothetical protein
MKNKNKISLMSESVEAELRFTVPQNDQTVVYMVGYECATITLEFRKVEIANGRASQEKFSIETNGFELIEYTSELTDFRNPDAVYRIFKPEAEQILKRLTGASRIFMFHHVVRDMAGARSDDSLTASTNTHVDHDQATYESHIRRCLPAGEADVLLSRRWAAYSIWKPMAPVEKLPLAVCDARTVFDENLISRTRRDGPHPRQAGLGVAFNPKQRWFYFPDMTIDEALVLKIWDTDKNLPQWVAHSAFVDPTSESDARPRVALDGRFIAFY